MTIAQFLWSVLGNGIFAKDEVSRQLYSDVCFLGHAFDVPGLPSDWMWPDQGRWPSSATFECELLRLQGQSRFAAHITDSIAHGEPTAAATETANVVDRLSCSGLSYELLAKAAFCLTELHHTPDEVSEILESYYEHEDVSRALVELQAVGVVRGVPGKLA
jgi:hypothetical protein